MTLAATGQTGDFRSGRLRITFVCLAAAIFAVAVVPFLQTAGHGLLNLDDYVYLSFRKELQQPLSVATWRTAFTDISDGIWMPLTWASYILDFALWGDGNWGMFHLHSVALHGVNAVLAFALFIQLLGIGGRAAGRKAVLAAAFGAMLWGAHPLRTESVAWLSSRKDVLSLAWLLLAMLAWTRWMGCGRNAAAQEGDGTVLGGLRLEVDWRARFWGSGFYWTAIGCFAAGAMAKPSVMCFPALCLLVDACLVRRVRPLAYVLPVCLAAALGILAGHAQAVGGATEILAGVPLWHRLLGACAAFGIYLWHTAWPADLAVQCVNRWPELPRFWLPGLAISLACAWWLWRRWQSLGPDVAALGWFAVSVFPMLGIAPFGYHAFADRFTYIPALGLSLGAAWWLAGARGRSAGVLAAALAVAYGCVAWRQTGFWRDEPTIARRTLAVDGDGNACAHSLLANWAFEFPHDLDMSVEEFAKAKAGDPSQIEGSFEIYVEALCEKGELERAREETEWLAEWIARDVDGREGNGQQERRKLMHGIYKAARVARMIHDPALRKVAAEELATDGGFPSDDAGWKYLRYRLKKVSGDEAGARAALRDLFANGNLRGYNQYRFLREEAGKD